MEQNPFKCERWKEYLLGDDGPAIPYDYIVLDPRYCALLLLLHKFQLRARS